MRCDSCQRDHNFDAQLSFSRMGCAHVFADAVV
jgi:hypothetical protein